MGGGDDQAPGRKLHPVYNVIDKAESAWARDRNQQWQRTVILVRELVDAGILNDGELIAGKYYSRNAVEGSA